MHLPNESNSDNILASEKPGKKDKNKHNLNACVDTITDYQPYLSMGAIGMPVQTYLANIIVKLPAGCDLDIANAMIGLTVFGAANSQALVYTINTIQTPPACNGPVTHTLQIPANIFNNADFLQIVIVHLNVTKGKTTTYKGGV